MTNWPSISTSSWLSVFSCSWWPSTADLLDTETTQIQIDSYSGIHKLLFTCTVFMLTKCKKIHIVGLFIMQEVNVTAVCNTLGQWEPSTDHICPESAGITLELCNHNLNWANSFMVHINHYRCFLKWRWKDSSCFTDYIHFTFFTFGCFCHNHHQKQTLAAPIENSMPMYETVLPAQDLERDMEL